MAITCKAFFFFFIFVNVKLLSFHTERENYKTQICTLFLAEKKQNAIYKYQVGNDSKPLNFSLSYDILFIPVRETSDIISRFYKYLSLRDIGII